MPAPLPPRTIPKKPENKPINAANAATVAQEVLLVEGTENVW